MAADILGLVESPLVGDFVLQNDFFGMSAMTEQRYRCHQHSQHRHRQRDWGKIRTLSGMLGVLVQFSQFVGHDNSYPALYSMDGRVSRTVVMLLQDAIYDHKLNCRFGHQE